MLFENYKILNILQNKNLVSVYKAIHLPTSLSVALIEFKKNINLVKNLEDVYFKILLSNKISNPLEIIDVFKYNNKFYIALPDNYLSIKFPFSGFPKSTRITEFLNNENLKIKYLYFYGNDSLRKSLMLIIIRIYLTIKNYFTFYFKPAYKTNIDDLFLKNFFSLFNFDTDDKIFLSKMKSKIYLDQNFLTLVHTIEKKIKKRKIAIIIDNINYISNPLREFLYSLSNYFMYSFPDENLTVILGSNRNKIHPLIKNIKKKHFLSVHFSKFNIQLLKYSLKKVNNNKYLKLANICNDIFQFYFLSFLINSQIIEINKINNLNSFYNILKILLKKFNKDEIEIIKLLYIIDYPINTDLISFLTKTDIYKIKIYLNNLIKNLFLFRIYTAEGIVYKKFLDSENKCLLNLINKFSGNSLIETSNIKKIKLSIYEKIGDYFLNFSSNIEKSLFFYIKAKNKKKSLLIAINLINLYNEIKLFEDSEKVINTIIKNFNLNNNEKTILLNEKLKILYSSGYLAEIIKTTKEALKIIPADNKCQREKIYFYQAIGYIYSTQLKKSRNIFKYLIRTSNNFKIIYYSKFYLIEIIYFMRKLNNFEEKIDKLKLEISSSRKISKKTKESLLFEIYILKTKYFIATNKLQLARNELNSLYNHNIELNLKSKIIHNILYALIKTQEGKSSEAILLVSETLPLIEDIKEQKLYSDIINLMGLIFYKSNSYISASIFLKKSLKLKKQIHDQLNSISILITLAEINIKQKRFKLALNYIFRAIKLSQKIDNQQKFDICSSLYNFIIHNQNSTHLGVR